MNRATLIQKSKTVTVVSLLFAAGAARAQAPAPAASGAPDKAPSELPAVVVTATRTEENSFALPYAISAVTAMDLERKMPRTMPEALREMPSVMLQKTSHGQGSPYLRGFTGFRTLMLVDGIRLNNSTFRDGPNQYWGTIDPLSIDRLEVVRGPSSVLYGSDAIGGTVNAITKGRQDYGEGVNWDGATTYRYSSAEDSHTGHPEASVQFNRKVGLHAGGSLKEFGDLRGGEDVGRQRKTGYGEWDMDAKAEWFTAPNARLVYGHQSVRMDDAWRTHATVYGLVWSGTTAGTDLQRSFSQSRDLDYLQYHVQKLEGFVEEAHLSLSHHYQGELEDRVRAAGNRELQDVDVHTLGLSAQLQSPSKAGRWIYGAEYYRDWVDSSYSGYNAAGNLTSVRWQGPVADDANYDLTGVYVENHLPLVEDRLELILGGRYTHAAVSAGKVQDPFNGRLLSMSDAWDNGVGNARLSWHPGPDKHWTVYGGASQGFRAPNLSDLTRFDIARSGEQEIPAFGLKPESFVSPEAGVKMQYDRFGAEAAYFHTFMDDQVVRVPTGAKTTSGDWIVNKENSGRGYVHGVELAGNVKPHRDWTL